MGGGAVVQALGRSQAHGLKLALPVTTCHSGPFRPTDDPQHHPAPSRPRPVGVPPGGRSLAAGPWWALAPRAAPCRRISLACAPLPRPLHHRRVARLARWTPAGGIADPHHSQRRSRVRRSATRRITPPVSTSRGLPLPRGDEATTRPASIHRAMVLGLSPVRRATAAGVWSAGGVRPHERQRSSPSQSAASRPQPQRQQALTGPPGRGPASSG